QAAASRQPSTDSMANTDVVMPQMGESIAEGTIVRWLKKVGDVVDRDEPLFEISTDKVDAEIPSPTGGVLAAIHVAEGAVAAVNSVVAVIQEAGDDAESGPAQAHVHDPGPAKAGPYEPGPAKASPHDLAPAN